MKPIRRILVPTDFSPHAAEAFRQALGLAGPLGASVVVFHVARPPAVVVDGGRLLTDPNSGEPRDLWADLRGIKAESSAVPVEHEVIVADRPGAAHILEILEKTGCDLIVMGTHGLTGLKHRLFGGVTEEVVRHARCPVLVVKQVDAAASDHSPETAKTKTPPGAESKKPGAVPAPKEPAR
jgi:nucleotide-binding universal stress UspA family protein